MSTLVESKAERWHDLDAVRAFALLLGIFLHGVMSFMEPRSWIFADSVTSTGANVTFYVIHIFRMTTFFVLAGFFARMLMEKRGNILGFMGNRLKRVGIPLVSFWPIVFVAIVAVMIVANMPAPGSPEAAMPPPPPPAFTVYTFPLTHLWFLYALLLLYAGTCIVKLVTDALRIGGVLGRGLDKVFGILVKTALISVLLILPLAAAFYYNDTWSMWFGIQTPDTGLFPNLMATAGFTTAYVFGWWLHRRADLIDYLSRHIVTYGISAAVGTWFCLSIAGSTPSFTAVNGADHPIYCLLYPLTAWSWTFFLIGAGRLLLRNENPLIRFVSDASYWVYIVHLPLILLFQWGVQDLTWPVEAKIAAVVLGTFATALLSYRLFVRYTFIGTILNGRRRKDKKQPTVLQEA